jgi:hypothetical protein
MIHNLAHPAPYLQDHTGHRVTDNGLQRQSKLVLACRDLLAYRDTGNYSSIWRNRRKRPAWLPKSTTKHTTLTKERRKVLRIAYRARVPSALYREATSWLRARPPLWIDGKDRLCPARVSLGDNDVNGPSKLCLSHN